MIDKVGRVFAVNKGFVDNTSLGLLLDYYTGFVVFYAIGYYLSKLFYGYLGAYTGDLLATCYIDYLHYAIVTALYTKSSVDAGYVAVGAIVVGVYLHIAEGSGGGTYRHVAEGIDLEHTGSSDDKGFLLLFRVFLQGEVCGHILFLFLTPLVGAARSGGVGDKDGEE